MTTDTTQIKKPDLELVYIVIISIVLAILLSSSLIIYEVPKDNFSTLTIKPESYNNFPDGQVSPYIMEVQSFEKGPTEYSADVFVNELLMDHITFILNPGEVYEEKKILDISNIQFPAKVLIELKTPTNKYSAHYWLKKNT